MIPIKKSTRNKPTSLNDSKCIESLKEVVNIANSAHKDKISSDIYRADDVYKRLKNLYNNKCAYCESYEPEPEIEHYRPKKRVSEDKTHIGYYWLCYEWTNLLPACHDCNKAGVKGNRFPIEGIRKYAPKFLSNNRDIDLIQNELTDSYLVEEKPLFLNPEIPDFDPFFYFEFDETGVFKAKQQIGTFEYRQAEETIDIVQLNRDKLYLNYRKVKIEELFQEQIKPLFDVIKDIDSFKCLYFKILKNIKAKTSPTKEYSFFWSYLYQNFPQYIIHYFKGKQRNPLLRLYNEFKNQNAD